MKKLHVLLILFILYSLTLGIRVYWLSQKEGFHADEGLSVTLACCNEYMWAANYELNREYTGKEVKEISLCDNDSFKNVLGDIYRLWKDNRDSPHTNLYYSLLRISLTGLKTGDIKPIIFRGGILNLIFFTVSVVFFFLLMRLLFPHSKLLQFSATFCAFLSTAAISGTLFLRPYQIQETMFIGFCYCLFRTFDLKKYIIHDNKLYINIISIFPLSIITAFTLLTGYYSSIFIGLFGLYVIYINFKKHDYQEIITYISTLCLGLLLAQAFYSRYFVGYVSHRAYGTAGTLFDGFFANIKASVIAVTALLQAHFFTYPVIIICVLCLIYLIFRKQKIFLSKPALCVLAVSILYSFIIMYIAPYKMLRYIRPIFPFLTVLPIALINATGNKKIHTIAALLLCVVFFKAALDKNAIEYLYQNKSDEYCFSHDISVPVFVLNKTPWKYADMVPYFNDKQLYYFIDTYENIDLTQHREFYIVIEKSLEMSDINFAQFEMKNGENFIMNVKPFEARVSVRFLEAEEKSEIGRFIPDNTSEKSKKSEIVNEFSARFFLYRKYSIED